MAILVNTTINGDAVEFVCQPDESLLDVLRNRVGLTGAKEGCGTGDCERMLGHSRRPADLFLPRLGR